MMMMVVVMMIMLCVDDARLTLPAFVLVFPPVHWMAEFKGFMTKVESISTTSGTDLEFDVPYRELGFYGVPQRATVFVMPTVHCIVHLVEPPFFVCTLEEVRVWFSCWCR